MYSGPTILSTATRTEGIAVKPKVSPQPTVPSSVVILTTRESTVCRPPLPHTAGADFPPTVNGIRRGNVSIFSIFIFGHPEVRINHKAREFCHGALLCDAPTSS